MANSYLITPSLGLLLAIGIAIHNIPEGFVMGVPASLVKRKKFVLKIAFLAAFAEPAGAIIGLFSASVIPGIIPYSLSFAAGAMIFVSLNELLPMARRYDRPRMLILGIIFSIFIYSGLSLLLS